MMGEHEHAKEIRKTFLLSRDGAIVRCASIMVNFGRKDLAKKILETARIDQDRLEALKTENTE